MSTFHYQATPSPGSDKHYAMIPVGIETKDDLLEFLQGAIPLPDYFGGNWDALEECLGDLSWLPDEKLRLIHNDIPMSDMPSDQKTYLQILAEAAKNSVRLHVIFPAHNRAEIERILAI